MEGSTEGKLLLTLPLPPTINQSYHAIRVGDGCKIVMDQRAKDYKSHVMEIVAYSWYSGEPFIVTKHTRFAIAVTMYLEKNTRDVDANIKLVMDGVIEGVRAATGLEGLSDVRVFEAHLQKVLIREMGEYPNLDNPCLVMELWEWKPRD